MKRLLFFITHSTLTVEHASLSFKSLSNQIVSDDKFDVLYIYNTHQHELSNNTLLELFDFYKLDKFFKKVCIFDYDETTVKSLGADIGTIRKYCELKYDSNDMVLLMKSDCYLSKNYFKDIFEFDKNNSDGYFTAPFVVSKARVKIDELIQYGNRNSFIPSDDITFFVEDERNSSNNDFTNRLETEVTDPKILFMSCRVQGDYSCHYMPIKLMKDLIISYDSWGGVKFYNIQHLCKTSNNSFVLHQYHKIISINRQTDREGPVKDWMNS